MSALLKPETYILIHTLEIYTQKRLGTVKTRFLCCGNVSGHQGDVNMLKGRAEAAHQSLASL